MWVICFHKLHINCYLFAIYGKVEFAKKGMGEKNAGELCAGNGSPVINFGAENVMVFSKLSIRHVFL